MAQETLTYFMSVNIPVQEIYGMSETAGVLCEGVREGGREGSSE